MKRLIHGAITVAAIALTALSMSAGDLKITFKSETKMLMTSKDTETHYYTSRYHRANKASAKQDTLTDYEQMVMYAIDHKKKTIGKLTMEDAQKIIEIMAAKLEEDPNSKQMMESMFGGNADAALSVVNDGTEVIIGKTCAKWNITLGTMFHKLSVTRSIELPLPKKYIEAGNKMKNATVAMLPGVSKLTEAASKVDGFPLKSEVEFKIGPITSRTYLEATGIEEGPIQASVFELPKKYKEEDLGQKLLEQINKSNK
jgi:hypothetical protein